MKGVINMATYVRFANYKGKLRYYLGCMLLDVILLIDVVIRLITLGIIHVDLHSYLLFHDGLDDWMDYDN